MYDVGKGFYLFLEPWFCEFGSLVSCEDATSSFEVERKYSQIRRRFAGWSVDQRFGCAKCGDYLRTRSGEPLVRKRVTRMLTGGMLHAWDTASHNWMLLAKLPKTTIQAATLANHVDVWKRCRCCLFYMV